MDSRFRIPGTRFRFGLDPLIGLIPVAGDTIALLLGLVVVADAWQLGARRSVLLRMVLNLGIDWLIGSIPLVGDVADFFIKPSRANVGLLLREQQSGRLTGTPLRPWSRRW
jgi:hypothetical protein